MNKKIVWLFIVIILLSAIALGFLMIRKGQVQEVSNLQKESDQITITENNPASSDLSSIGESNDDTIASSEKVDPIEEINIWSHCENNLKSVVDASQADKLKKELKPDDDAVKLNKYDFSIEKSGHMFYGEKDLSNSKGQVYIKGDIILNSKYLAKLPNNLFVDGYLHIYKVNSKLEISKSIKTSSSLILSGFKDLPDDAVVGKDLIISESKIEKLPEGLMVGENLTARNSLIRNMPKSFYVGKNIYLDRSQISILPENLQVHGDLNLTETLLKYLPCGLVVKNSLIISGTSIGNLPDDMKVNEVLDARNTPLDKIFSDNKELESEVRNKIGAKEIF